MKASGLITVSACLLAVSSQTHLTAAPKKSGTIDVTVAGLGCSTAVGADSFAARSWAWGAENVTDGTGGGGGSAGKSSVSQLSLARVSDACSPALLGGVMTGKHYASLSLSQYDSAGALTATVVLNDVILTNWEIGGSNSSAEAAEQLRVAFSRFTFTDAASGNKFCYDAVKAVPC